ncbi:MAG: hypothetical protein ACKO6F_01285, partial [Cyanobium sp.]
GSPLPHGRRADSDHRYTIHDSRGACRGHGYRESYIGGRYLRDGHAVKGYQDAAAGEEAAANGSSSNSNGRNGSFSNGNGKSGQARQRRSGRRGTLGWLRKLPRAIPFLGRGRRGPGAPNTPNVGTYQPELKRPRSSDSGAAEQGNGDRDDRYGR